MDTTLDQAKKWTAIIRKIWDDPQTKDLLLSDPQAFLKEHGIETAPSQSVAIHENTAEHLHFVIPKKPPKELSDEVLSHIVAGLHYSR